MPPGEVNTVLLTEFSKPINLMNINVTSSAQGGALDPLDRFSVDVVNEDGQTILSVNNKVMLKDRYKLHDIEARPSSLHSLLNYCR